MILNLNHHLLRERERERETSKQDVHRKIFGLLLKITRNQMNNFDSCPQMKMETERDSWKTEAKGHI